MSLHPLELDRSLRRLIRRALCDRFGHAWRLRNDYFYCRACHVSGQDDYYRRRRSHRFAA